MNSDLLDPSWSGKTFRKSWLKDAQMKYAKSKIDLLSSNNLLNHNQSLLTNALDQISTAKKMIKVVVPVLSILLLINLFRK